MLNTLRGLRATPPAGLGAGFEPPCGFGDAVMALVAEDFEEISSGSRLMQWRLRKKIKSGCDRLCFRCAMELVTALRCIEQS